MAAMGSPTPPEPRLPDQLKRISGELSYSSPVPWIWREEGERLTLAPRRWPHPTVLVAVLLGVPGFCAAVWLGLRGRANVSDALLATFTILIPIATIAAAALVHHLQTRGGPWLVHAAGTLALPRAGVTLCDDEVHLVQVVSGVHGQGGSNPIRVSEVHVITVAERNGEEPVWRRHGLVGTLDSESAREVARRVKRAIGKLPADPG